MNKYAKKVNKGQILAIEQHNAVHKQYSITRIATEFSELRSSLVPVPLMLIKNN